MRKWICILLCFWSGMTCIAQEGTRFETLTLQEALKKAEREGKKVFVDCYTKTCGPCKYMVKYIFPLKACGDYFNAHYVCIMVDTQEGEGIEIAKKYRVQMHPTYLILNTDGTLFCSLMGGVARPEDDFVQKVKNQVKLTEMNQQFAKGKRDRNFMEEYLLLLQERDKNQLQRVLGEIWPKRGVKELSKADAWQVIKTELTQIDNPLFRYLLSHRQEFVQQLGKQEVDEKLLATYANEFRMNKRMGMDFEKRMADLEMLAKEQVKGAEALKYTLFVGQIVQKKQRERVDELLKLLTRLEQELPCSQERTAVLKELNGVERFATPEQKKAIVTALQTLSKHFQTAEKEQLEQLMLKLRN